MLYVRDHFSGSDQFMTPALSRVEARRRERLYEIEFFRGGRVDADELLEARIVAPDVSGLAALPRDQRLVRAIVAAANGWVVDRMRDDE